MTRTEERDEEARLLSPEVIGASDDTRTDAANLRGTQEEVSCYLGGGFVGRRGGSRGSFGWLVAACDVRNK